MDTVGYLLIGWQKIGDAIGGDAYGLLLVAFECPTGYYIVFLFANEETDGVAILRFLKLVVDARAVEVELADELGLKLDHFEFNNDISAKFEVVEQEVSLELIAIDCEDFLTTYERESVAEFEEELDYVLFECELEILFLIVLIESEELEVVGVFEYVACQIGIRLGEGVGKVGKCLTLSLV